MKNGSKTIIHIASKLNINEITQLSGQLAIKLGSIETEKARKDKNEIDPIAV